jgi:type VI secretion system secreted protein Hcp
MAGSGFIKFDGVAIGEAYDEVHPGTAGWIEIKSWSWDVEAETSFTTGGGAAVGKPKPGVISFTHAFDKASPVLLKNIVQGTSFPTVTIELCKSTGKADGTVSTYFKLEMKDAFTTKVANNGGDDGLIDQTVDLVCKEIKIDYQAQKQDNSLEAAIKFGWDIAKMKII